MNKNDIREAYGSLKLSKEESAGILASVQAGRSARRAFPGRMAVLAAALLLLFMSPAVRVRASQWLEKLQYTLFSDSGEELPVTMESQEVKYAADIPAKFNSLPEAEAAFGIDLLDTTDETCVREGQLVHYYPMLVRDRENRSRVCGMTFQDFAYVTGDLKEFTVLPADAASPSVQTEFRYGRGGAYGSPIAVQIRLITDANLAEEAGFPAAEEINVQDQEHRSENESVEIYHIAGINTDAMIVSTRNVSLNGMGPALWESPNPGIEHIVTAYLSYEGIEYEYFGDISADTMKAFLDTLQ